MRADEKYVRFDWAIKRMLRDKANYDVLEGFISVFTGEIVKIDSILESEGNQDAYDDKFNRVDIKARKSDGEIIIVEVQLSREVHYLERVVYGTAKAITEQLTLGRNYDGVKKVISISIVYFDLGKGSDYLYHGQVRLEGVHNHDILTVTAREKKGMNLPDENVHLMRDPSDIFPEYYLIRVNEFNDYARTPLEEWMDYLKNGVINDDTKAPGLQEAKEKLQYLMMNDADRIAYERHVDALRIQFDVLGNARAEGLEEGMREGMKEGMKEGMREGMKEGMKKGMEKGIEEGMKKGEQNKQYEIASNMKSLGIDKNTIAKATGLSADIIDSI